MYTIKSNMEGVGVNSRCIYKIELWAIITAANINIKKLNKLMITFWYKYAKSIWQYDKKDTQTRGTCLLYSRVCIAYKSIGMDNSYVRPTYSRPGCRCALTGRGARTPGRRPTKGSRCPRCVSSSCFPWCCSHCRRWHGLDRLSSRLSSLLTTVVKVCPLLHSSPGSRLKQQWTSVWFYSHKINLRNLNQNYVTSNTHIYTLEWPHFTWWVNIFWNQQRIGAKTITLGANTTVLTFQRNPLRGTDVSPHPSSYGIVTHLRTCPFDSHMCSIVSL